MISVDQHLAAVLDAVPLLPECEVALPEAHGGVLAEVVTAPMALPPFDNSAMDGYAVVAADIAGASSGAPVRLPVLGDILAGDTADHTITAGTCVRIMTGAPMPPGADTVVPVEWTDGGAASVEIRQSAEPGTYVRRSGEDVVAGQVVLPSGTRLGATRLAVAAAVGRGRVTIRRRPRLAVLSTGSELVEPGKPVTRGQIWDSNSYMLVAAATEAGMLAVRRTSLDDDPAAVLAAIEGLLDEVDVIVTSGGVSMGTRDVVKEVLTGRGTMRFEQVAMRPGKPQGFGMLDGRTPVFTLPGNPVSAYVSFQIFVAPALRRMQGLSVAANPVVTARLSGPVTSPAGLRHFLRGVLDDKSGTVRAVEGQGSHHLAALAGANALIVIDENATDVPAGAPVTVWRLPS